MKNAAMSSYRPSGVQLPREIECALLERFLPSERIVYGVVSDLTRERQFGDSFVIGTNKRIAVGAAYPEGSDNGSRSRVLFCMILRS
jgi:hypothetical protein